MAWIRAMDLVESYHGQILGILQSLTLSSAKTPSYALGHECMWLGPTRNQDGDVF